jgi:hypothetical protein
MPTQVLSIRDSLISGFTTFVNFIPLLIGAVVLLLLGWYIAKLVGMLVERILVRLRLDHVADRTHFSQFLTGPEGRYTASHGIGALSKWFVFLIFVQAAANILAMPQVTSIINSILLFIPNLVVAFVILVVGAYLARFLSGLVRGAVARTPAARPELFALITEYAIMGFAVIAALNQVGIAVVLVNTLYIGLVASLALAIGLAFGLGGQGVASEVTRNWYEQGRAGRLKSVPTEGGTSGATGTGGVSGSAGSRTRGI